MRSPNHPEAYLHNRECIYVIKQPVGKAIVLNFTSFDIEHSGSSCYFDYVEVRVFRSNFLFLYRFIYT